MELATCSYAGWRAGMGTPVRVTLGQPRWRPPGRQSWLFVAELAPRPWYFNAAPEMFQAQYLAQLDRLCHDVEMKLGWLADAYGPLTLCCFERDISDPLACHRRMFAAWWQERTGQPVPELEARGR